MFISLITLAGLIVTPSHRNPLLAMPILDPRLTLVVRQIEVDRPCFNVSVSSNLDVDVTIDLETVRPEVPLTLKWVERGRARLYAHSWHTPDFRVGLVLLNPEPSDSFGGNWIGTGMQTLGRGAAVSTQIRLQPLFYSPERSLVRFVLFDRGNRIVAESGVFIVEFPKKSPPPATAPSR